MEAENLTLSGEGFPCGSLRVALNLSGLLNHTLLVIAEYINN